MDAFRPNRYSKRNNIPSSRRSASSWKFWNWSSTMIIMKPSQPQLRHQLHQPRWETVATLRRLAQQDKHSHSHSHQQTKLVKSELTVDTDSGEKLTPAASASVGNYGRSMAHIHTPAEGFEVAEEGEKCIRCRKKNLPRAVKPGRACWQCYCSRSGCSTFAATGRRVASRAPTPWQSCKQRASTGTTPGLTSRSPSAKPAVSCQQSKSFVLCILIC